MDAEPTVPGAASGAGGPPAGPCHRYPRLAAEDADLMADLQIQSLGYQAALAITTQVVQPSLLDFLR